jgi:RNA polymerase sigma-70 factor (ECF subfamily)
VDPSPGEVTQLLIDLEKRKQDAAPKLFALLYGELRRMAQRHLQNERPGHTLQATALVNEAYVRLVGDDQGWRNRAHFFGIASSAMRRILVEHARRKHAAKRPSSQQRVELDDVLLVTEDRSAEIISLDIALERLSQIDPRQGRIVELRYFGGLTAKEAGEALGISTITVQREWVIAKAWLHGELAAQLAEP